MSLNLIYAIDENYNTQAVVSIKSFLENSNSTINVYILHKDADSFSPYKQILDNESDRLTVDILQFNNDGLKFPRVSGTHISEATYYRLYLDKYLPRNLENVIYVDADVLCTNRIDAEISNIFLEMNQNNLILGAKTDEIRDDFNNDINWDGILMKGNNYFNAGVLFINYKKWLENDHFSKLRKRQIEIEDDLYFWDQDILNSYFDGKYFEIGEKFNFRVGLDSKVQKYETTKRNSLFIHYQGSWKPWSVRGCYHENSRFYQDYYKNLGFGDYHLVHTWRINSIFHFIAGILKFKIFKLNYPIKFIISVSKSLLIR
jgi:lipopolysaccharide biosynthesis glycosyltransferase